MTMSSTTAMTPKASCISFKDSACRCFGFMMSKKKYVFTIDDDSWVRIPDLWLGIHEVTNHNVGFVSFCNAHQLCHSLVFLLGFNGRDLPPVRFHGTSTYQLPKTTNVWCTVLTISWSWIDLMTGFKGSTRQWDQCLGATYHKHSFSINSLLFQHTVWSLSEGCRFCPWVSIQSARGCPNCHLSWPLAQCTRLWCTHTAC